MGSRANQTNAINKMLWQGVEMHFIVFLGISKGLGKQFESEAQNSKLLRSYFVFLINHYNIRYVRNINKFGRNMLVFRTDTVGHIMHSKL